MHPDLKSGFWILNHLVERILDLKFIFSWDFRFQIWNPFSSNSNFENPSQYPHSSYYRVYQKKNASENSKKIILKKNINFQFVLILQEVFKLTYPYLNACFDPFLKIFKHFFKSTNVYRVNSGADFYL